MNYAEEIKSRVTPKQLFSYYGFPPDRSGFVKCPLHGERTASLKVYDDWRGWCCHGCHKGGDVINFVRDYFGLDFRDACAKINEDFRLGLPIGERIDRRKQIEMGREAFRRKQAQEQRERRAKELEDAFWTAFERWHNLDTQKRLYAPQSPSDGFHPLFIEALQNIDGAEYELNCAELARYEHEHGVG